MEPRLLGWPADGPTLDLDHRRFAYAGKFVMSGTGKAVIETDTEAGEVVAAVAFSPDRTEPTTAWLRYVTVRADRQGEGLGPRLCAFVTRRLLEADHDRVRIAVNNPAAYEALYRAGFAWTGEETGIAELVLEHPSDRDPDRYRAGYERFAAREEPLGEAGRGVLAAHRDGDPPPVVAGGAGGYGAGGSSHAGR